MRLLELELENWGRHEKLKVDLSGSLQIGGRNGTGKSSILEAVRFIFSESGRGYNGRIRKGAAYTRVKLRFRNREDTYSIEKKLYLKKPSAATMWVNREPVADNASTVYKRLSEFVTEDLIDNLVYVRQGSLTEIINRLRVKGGRQELDRLFGLDKLEGVYKAVGEEIRAKEASHESLLTQLAKYPEDAVKEYGAEQGSLGETLKGLENKTMAELREQRIREQKISQAEKRIAEIKAVKKARDESERKLGELRVEEASLARDIEAMEANLAAISEKKAEAEKLASAAEGLRRFAGFRDLLSGLEADESRARSLGDLEAKKKQLLQAEKELNGRYSIEMEHESASKKIVELSNKTAVIRQKLTEKKAFIHELSSLSGKAACPKCGQRLLPEHLAGERKTAESEIKELEKESREQSSLLLAEKNKITPLEKQLTRFRELEAETRQRKEELEKGVKEREGLLRETEDLRKQLAGLGYRNESSKQVEEKIAELGKIEGRIIELKADAAKEKQLLERRASSEKKAAEIKARRKEIESGLLRLVYDEKQLADLERRRDETKDQMSRLALEIERMRMQADEARRRSKELEEKKQEFLELTQKEKSLASETSLLREARDVFHTDKGLVKYLREKYIRQLGLVLTQNFRKINQNPKYRDVVFDKDYELEIKSTEGSFSLDQLSGGEIVQLAIALRLSLMELLSPLRLLMLDEPFGSLDKGHREALGEALNRIAGEGQLIIVTHIPVDSLQLPELELTGY